MMISLEFSMFNDLNYMINYWFLDLPSRYFWETASIDGDTIVYCKQSGVFRTVSKYFRLFTIGFNSFYV